MTEHNGWETIELVEKTTFKYLQERIRSSDYMSKKVFLLSADNHKQQIRWLLARNEVTIWSHQILKSSDVAFPRCRPLDLCLVFGGVLRALKPILNTAHPFVVLEKLLKQKILVLVDGHQHGVPHVSLYFVDTEKILVFLKHSILFLKRIRNHVWNWFINVVWIVYGPEELSFLSA